ncbi:hypothetical protein DRE_01100 [Drechslerella stenobrocha 248]|uniref:NodB homology domain-containing protein n=1 Tax=Drechslerella stenobrocha 248 TaxID=1043628 RepID=W7HME1_9PEZI|nr:hypothetical protein DRE_01100 [Drechslerella stenobrocha 248]
MAAYTRPLIIFFLLSILILTFANGNGPNSTTRFPADTSRRHYLPRDDHSSTDGTQFGWCGDSENHCLITSGCQLAFGRCTSLADYDFSKLIKLRRRLLGKVPYGTPIFNCRTTGQIALTYDDGPYLYTVQLLDILKAAGAKATFFITGSNLAKGPIDNESLPWANLIRRMYREGHQIASHTWTHPDLQSLSESNRRNEMYRLELALSRILGFFPAYMRPPYSSCGDQCHATMLALGYRVIYFDLDTDDYNHALPDQIHDSVVIATQGIEAVKPRSGSILSIAHDVHPLSVSNLTVAMLRVIKENGFKTVTVGECLGDPESHWYRKL